MYAVWLILSNFYFVVELQSALGYPPPPPPPPPHTHTHTHTRIISHKPGVHYVWMSDRQCTVTHPLLQVYLVKSVENRRVKLIVVSILQTKEEEKRRFLCLCTSETILIATELFALTFDSLEQFRPRLLHFKATTGTLITAARFAQPWIVLLYKITCTNTWQGIAWRGTNYTRLTILPDIRITRSRVIRHRDVCVSNSTSRQQY